MFGVNFRVRSPKNWVGTPWNRMIYDYYLVVGTSWKVVPPSKWLFGNTIGREMKGWCSGVEVDTRVSGGRGRKCQQCGAPEWHLCLCYLPLPPRSTTPGHRWPTVICQWSLLHCKQLEKVRVEDLILIDLLKTLIPILGSAEDNKSISPTIVVTFTCESKIILSSRLNLNLQDFVFSREFELHLFSIKLFTQQFEPQHNFWRKIEIVQNTNCKFVENLFVKLKVGWYTNASREHKYFISFCHATIWYNFENW